MQVEHDVSYGQLTLWLHYTYQVQLEVPLVGSFQELDISIGVLRPIYWAQILYTTNVCKEM